MSISRWMDKEVGGHVYNGILLSYKEEQHFWVSSNEVDETGPYYTEWSKSERKTPIQYINIYMEFRKMVTMTLYVRQQKRHRYKEQTFELWEKVRVGWFEVIALKHVYYHMWNRSPVQVRCMRQGAQGQCTGRTLRDGDGEGGGIGVQDGGHMYTRGWFMAMYGKTTIILSSN